MAEGGAAEHEGGGGAVDGEVTGNGAGASDNGGRRLAVVAGVVAVAVAALIAYLVWPRTPEHVLIVGDSVTYLSWEALDREFGAGTKLEPIARPGFRSTDLLPLVQEAVDARADSGKKLDRAAFLVGYNDIWKQALDDDRLAEMVELSARYECAVWLSVPARPAGDAPATGDFDPDLADEWNDRLADMVGEHRNLHLVDDWAEAIEGASSPEEYLEPDGIHPNADGQELLAKTMHDAVLNACRFPLPQI